MPTAGEPSHDTQKIDASMLKRKMSLLSAILLVFSLMALGCNPPMASVLTTSMPTPDEQIGSYYFEVQGDEVYEVLFYYSLDSLNYRLSHDVGALKITLLNDTEISASDGRLTCDSLMYFREGVRESLPLSTVQRVRIINRVDGKDAFQAGLIGAGSFAVGAIAIGANRESFGEVARSFGLGALIGIPVGVFSAYGGSRDIDTVLINGYDYRW